MKANQGIAAVVFVAAWIISPNPLAGDPPALDSVKIARIQPRPSEPLYPGQKVKIEVTVEYSLNTEDSGTVAPRRLTPALAVTGGSS